MSRPDPLAPSQLFQVAALAGIPRMIRGANFPTRHPRIGSLIAFGDAPISQRRAAGPTFTVTGVPDGPHAVSSYMREFIV